MFGFIHRPSSSSRKPGKRQTRPAVEQLEERSLLAVGLISFNYKNTGSQNTGGSFSNMSADGRFVVFQTAATDLVKGITDVTGGGGGDIYVRDRLLNKNILVSISKSGHKTANYSSMNPNISANGRYVLFESESSDLTSNASNNGGDIFSGHHANVYQRDIIANKTYLVSVDTRGVITRGTTSTISDSPQMAGRFISSNGRYVVFQSDASDLVTNDKNGNRSVFMRDMTKKKTYLVSTGLGIGVGSDHPVVSADGRYVAFDSTDGTVRIRDMVKGKTYLAGSGFLPRISADGHVVTFTNIVSGAPYSEILATNIVTGKHYVVSASRTGGTANAGSYDPVISDSGRYVAFDSLANNLVTNDHDGNGGNIDDKDVFVRDLTTGKTALVSVNSTGKNSGNFRSDSPAISGDGQYIAYESQATNLVPHYVQQFNDPTYNYDLFLYNTKTHKTTLITAQHGTTTKGSNEGAKYPVVSIDGRYVSFHSMSTNLVTTKDFNSIQTDIFVSPAPYKKA